MFRQHYATAFFAEAKEKEVAITARILLASGLLSGKYTGGTRFQPGDHRNYNANGEAFNVGERFLRNIYSKYWLSIQITGFM